MSVEIGMRLRKAREQMGFSLVQVARELNIELKYLIAIEKGRFELLPNLIYARAYVKAYADLVGERVRFPQTTNQDNFETSHTHAGNTQSNQRQTPRGSKRNTSFQQQTNYSSEQKHKNYQMQTLRPRSDLLDTEKEQRPITSKVMKEILTETETKKRKIVVPPEVDEFEETQEVEYNEMENKEEIRTLSRSQTHQKQQGDGVFDSWYTRFLIAGGILLIIASALFLYKQGTSSPGLPVNAVLFLLLK